MKDIHSKTCKLIGHLTAVAAKAIVSLWTGLNGESSGSLVNAEAKQLSLAFEEKKVLIITSLIVRWEKSPLCLSRWR